MVKLYLQRLQQLGVEEPEVNSSRLKLLAEIPELEAHKQGRDVLLAFQNDVGIALSQASDYSDAIILGKAAKNPHLMGLFMRDFVGMVEHGADIKSQLRFGASKTDFAIAQLLQYNCYASISVFQHPIKDYKGEERGQLKFGEDKVKVIPELPDSFTNIHPAFFTKKYPVPPKSNVTENIVTGPDNSLHMSQLALEYEWLEKVTVTDGPVDVTWSAHHASKKRHPEVRNEPRNVVVSAEFISRVKGVSLQTVMDVTTQNALRLFPKITSKLRP
ncbi:hypothetical protein NQZ68_037698 [Dissostichus eleginoides]|nr:hypothetical protein NQZ68_037698 [Dissostichus eleginoides]